MKMILFDVFILRVSCLSVCSSGWLLPLQKKLVEQMPDYATRRLMGLDVLPSDAKAMMKAKATKRITAARGNSDNENNARGRTGAVCLPPSGIPSR